MGKNGGCCTHQINLDAYLTDVQKKRARQYRKKSISLGNTPFHYIVFLKAYQILRQNGEIMRPEILELDVPVHYEVYESLYLNALKSVYLYCRLDVMDDALAELLPDMYEREFEWMENRMKPRKTDTA